MQPATTVTESRPAKRPCQAVPASPRRPSLPCEIAGPRMVFLSGCEGTVLLDRPVYSCSTPVSLYVDDSDLRGVGTTTVSVFSSTETDPETVTLTESPVGSGHLSAILPTTSAAAVQGDGLLSVANGDTITAHYTDASACGAPNVGVDKTAAVDCAYPVLSGIQATGLTSSGATITWLTNESASGTVHYGTAPPGSLSATSAATGTSHSQGLGGLTPCTTYYFWVDSTDGAGNVSASNSGGGYYSFTTGNAGAPASFNSTGPPVTIFDNQTAIKTINVADARTVQDVNATMNITHSYDGDLLVELLAPNAASITLSNRRGASGNNYTNTVFDDEAISSIVSGSPPFTGTFKPEDPLNAFDLLPGGGNWTLKVTDQATVDTGTINSWSLTLTYPGACPAAGDPPPVPDGMTASRGDLSGSSIHVSWDATTCPAKNYHLLYGPLASVSSYTVSGAVCAAGPLGSYTWTGVPSGDLWYVVVGENESDVEGSWGQDSSGAQIGGTAASGQCGFTSRSNAGTCP